MEYLYYFTRFYISARYNQTIKIKFTKKISGSQMINIYDFQNRAKSLNKNLLLNNLLN